MKTVCISPRRRVYIICHAIIRIGRDRFNSCRLVFRSARNESIFVSRTTTRPRTLIHFTYYEPGPIGDARLLFPFTPRTVPAATPRSGIYDRSLINATRRSRTLPFYLHGIRNSILESNFYLLVPYFSEVSNSDDVCDPFTHL